MRSLKRQADWVEAAGSLAMAEASRPGLSAERPRQAAQAARSGRYPPAPWLAAGRSPLRVVTDCWWQPVAKQVQRPVGAVQTEEWVALAVPRPPATTRWLPACRAAGQEAGAAASPCRTTPEMRWARTDRRLAPQPPDVGRWFDRQSARWRCWPTLPDRAAPVSAAQSQDWDRARWRPEAAVAAWRSHRLAGRATSSPGSSTMGMTSIPPAAGSPVPAPVGDAGQMCRQQTLRRLEPALLHP